MGDHYIQLVVQFMDDSTRYFAIGPNMEYKSWSLRKVWGIEYLLIQRHEKVNRVVLPMQNIRSIEVHYREEPTNE